MIKKYYRLSCAFIALFCCAQFSNQSSVEHKEKPSINFYGELTDKTGRTFKIENILISGRYKQIPVYYEPSKGEKNDPKNHIDKIDLREIKKITVPESAPKKYKKRKYIDIIITHKDGSSDTYIVEVSRQLFGDRPLESGPIEKVIKLKEIKSLTIEGSKENKQKKNEE